MCNRANERRGVGEAGRARLRRAREFHSPRIRKPLQDFLWERDGIGRELEHAHPTRLLSKGTIPGSSTASCGGGTSNK